MFSWDKLEALNVTLYLEDNWRLSGRLAIVGNLQLAYNERDSRDVFPSPELRPWYSHSSGKYRYFYSENSSNKQAYRAVNPRVGAIYNTGILRGNKLFALNKIE